jgi:hypothetical protein
MAETTDHNESSSVRIYWTTDYGRFKWKKGNRDLNERKINKIKKSVQNGLDLFKYNPILVNEQMYIIDGQHRFTVCQQMKLNVYYVIVPDFSLRMIAEMNNNTTKWNSRDFLGCYMDVGIDDYTRLHEFVNDHHLTLSVAINLLHTGKVNGGGGHAGDAFKDGKFEVRFMGPATDLMKLSDDYADVTDCNRDRSFLQAMEILMASDTYRHEAVISKIRRHGLRIEKRSSYKDYLAAIEEAYNYHNQKRVTIY